MAGRYSVLDSFTVTTPSLSVVIRADDTPLPSDLKAQANPSNLVTVHAVEAKESVAPGSEEARALELQASDEQPPNDEQQQQRALQERQIRLQRMYERQQSPNLFQCQFKELKDYQELETALRTDEAHQISENAGILQMLNRADSKHAERIYSRSGAPTPIKPLDAVVSEEDSEGFIRKLSTYDTKDFTYWDKLKRRNTETVIRRWHTYVPTGEEDTAFFERNIEAKVPGVAYVQGIYYKQLDVVLGAKEYKLPTEQYVAPPVFVRRTGSPEKRIYDPIRQMARNMHSCFTCSSC